MLFWLLTDVKTVNPVDSFQCRVSVELIINVVYTTNRVVNLVMKNS